MALSNRELLAMVNKMDTSTLAAGGLLAPEQAKQFIKQVFDELPFSKLHRKEIVSAPTGEIPSIGIGRRIIRLATEAVDDNYRAEVSSGKLTYATKKVRLPWELTEDLLRRNIEGEAFEQTVVNLMTAQLGQDLEDLHFNGDESQVDDPFLRINDGWIKQLVSANQHVIDHTADIGNKFGKKTFFKMLAALPNKYRFQVRWLVSPTRKLLWQEYLTARATSAGDLALLGQGDQTNSPLGFPFVEVPSMPDNVMILTRPENFVSVTSWEIRVRKTTEGVTAIMQDKRFYVVFLDDDAIIERPDAAVLCVNVPTSFGDLS